MTASFLVPAMLVAFLLRLACAQGELWLDEIWSLQLAQQITSPAQILTDLHHDNSHPLNTLVVYLAGPGRSAAFYRLPAVASGTLTVGLAAAVAARWGRVTSLTMAALTATSYLLVHYASEARGYAFALVFVLAGLEALLRFEERPRACWAIAFWVCCGLGFLSHPTFLHFWLATGCWSLVAANRATAGKVPSLARAATCHAVPLALAAACWHTQWSRIELGGGPSYWLVERLVAAASWSIGGPGSGPAAVVSAAVALAGLSAGIWRLGLDRWGLLLAYIVLLPVLLAIAVRPPFLFVRYFLLAVPCVLLAVSVWLTHLYRQGRWGRWCFAGLLAAYFTANTVQTLNLVRLGRGQYSDALAWMASETPSGEITISSDHNFGIGKLVAFYGPQVRPPRTFRYIPGQSWRPTAPQWLVLHQAAEDAAAVSRPTLHIDSLRFDLAASFDCAPLSGWRWLCYRRVTE